MKRSDFGNWRNLPKLRHESKLLQWWLAERLAQTVPTASQRAHSCIPSSVHPPNKTLLWKLATVGQQHQPHQPSDPLQVDAHSHAPQADFSWFLPSVAPAHRRLTDFRENLARATQVFRAAGVDDGQSDDSLENASTLHDALVLAQRHFSGQTDSEIGLEDWQRLMVLSRRTCQAHLPRTPFSSGNFSLTESCGTLCWCHSHLRRCLTSLLSMECVMAPALACPALHSVLPT